jgi:hypothetical protein
MFNVQRQVNLFLISPMQCSDLICALATLVLNNSFSAMRQTCPEGFLYVLVNLFDGLHAECPIIYSMSLKKSASIKFDLQFLQERLPCVDSGHPA